MPDVTWFDHSGAEPDWDTLENTLAVRIDGSRAETQADRDDNDFFIMFNSSERNPFSVCPACTGRVWKVAIDTALASPNDVRKRGEELSLVLPDQYLVKPRSLVTLLC